MNSLIHPALVITYFAFMILVVVYGLVGCISPGTAVKLVLSFVDEDPQSSPLWESAHSVQGRLASFALALFALIMIVAPILGHKSGTAPQSPLEKGISHPIGLILILGALCCVGVYLAARPRSIFSILRLKQAAMTETLRNAPSSSFAAVRLIGFIFAIFSLYGLYTTIVALIKDR